MKTNIILSIFLLLLIVILTVRIVTIQPKVTNTCTFKPNFSVQYSQNMSIGDDMFFNGNQYKVERINMGITSEYDNGVKIYPTLDISLQGLQPLTNN